MSREVARWTFAGGSREAGAIEYADGCLFAHHDTCPARGNNNAWDLVRKHRFGELDKDCPPKTPIADRPSQKAMIKFAESLPEIRAARAGRELTDMGDMEQTETTDAPERRRFVFQPASEFASGPPLQWIVRGVLPKAELAIIFGPPGCGKSFLALDLSKAIATPGATWNGRKVKHGKVAYVCAEGRAGMRARVRANVIPDDVMVLADAPNLTNEKDAAALILDLQQAGPFAVVVIDTLARVAPGADENSSQDMGKVQAHCSLIHEETGALVVLVSHTGKDATKGQRGWSGWKGATDVEIEVTRNGDYRAWSTGKVKDGADDIEGSFKLPVVDLGLDEEGEPVTSCRVEHLKSDAPKPVKLAKPEHEAESVLRTICANGPVPYDDAAAALIKAKGYSKGEVKGYHKRDARKMLTRLVSLKRAFMHGDDMIHVRSLIVTGEEGWLS